LYLVCYSLLLLFLGHVLTVHHTISTIPSAVFQYATATTMKRERKEKPKVPTEWGSASDAVDEEVPNDWGAIKAAEDKEQATKEAVEAEERAKALAANGKSTKGQTATLERKQSYIFEDVLRSCAAEEGSVQSRQALMKIQVRREREMGERGGRSEGCEQMTRGVSTAHSTSHASAHTHSPLP
jgi:hypothetical protein